MATMMLHKIESKKKNQSHFRNQEIAEWAKVLVVKPDNLSFIIEKLHWN